VAELPTPVWGRDELGAGEMWNSNSVISWLLLRSGVSIEPIQPPPGGRAPGWNAGIVVARRDLRERVITSSGSTAQRFVSLETTTTARASRD
jgi:hypothetical protein